jgi:hypothetical protein
MEKTISQFIPIIVIFVLLSYPLTATLIAHSILGRFIAVAIILFYTSVDKYLGLFVCGLVIYYYQLELDNVFIEKMTNVIIPIPPTTCKPTKPPVSEIGTLLNNSYKQFTYYKTLYDDFFKPDDYDIGIAKEFRKQYCSSNGELIYKNSIINPNMISHVFPEIKFNNSRCNPCDKSCSYSIIESKIIAEEQMRPISTLP